MHDLALFQRSATDRPLQYQLREKKSSPLHSTRPNYAQGQVRAVVAYKFYFTSFIQRHLSETPSVLFFRIVTHYVGALVEMFVVERTWAAVGMQEESAFSLLPHRFPQMARVAYLYWKRSTALPLRTEDSIHLAFLFLQTDRQHIMWFIPLK